MLCADLVCSKWLYIVGGRADVADKLLDAHSIQAKENEKKLKSVLECCGKQNIALRGHRNEKMLVSDSECNVDSFDFGSLINKEEGNPGNFLALLEFRAKACDLSVLRDFHLHKRAGGTGGKKVTYCSATCQNQLIDCCAEYIGERILAGARCAPFYSIMAEATDTANMEQMPIVIRFVEDYEVQEEFLGFVNCDTGLTGKALAAKILGAAC